MTNDIVVLINNKKVCMDQRIETKDGFVCIRHVCFCQHELQCIRNDTSENICECEYLAQAFGSSMWSNNKQDSKRNECHVGLHFWVMQSLHSRQCKRQMCQRQWTSILSWMVNCLVLTLVCLLQKVLDAGDTFYWLFMIAWIMRGAIFWKKRVSLQLWWMNSLKNWMQCMK